jgi:hypothetical protein
MAKAYSSGQNRKVVYESKCFPMKNRCPLGVWVQFPSKLPQMKNKTTTRNAFSIAAKRRKAGKITKRSVKRANGKNKQTQYLEEATS